MSKRLLFFIFLNIVFFISCQRRQDSVLIEYEADRLFYWANKGYQSILINPNIASEEDFDIAIKSFRSIGKKFRNYATRSQNIRSIVRRSELDIPALFIIQKNFQAALQEYDRIIQENKLDTLLQASARFNKASLYEKLGDLKQALDEYKIFMASYSSLFYKNEASFQFLQVPIRIARLKKIMKDKNSNLEYKQARRFYRQLLVTKSKNIPYSLLYQLIALTFSESGQWQSTVRVLKEFLATHGDTIQEPGVLLEIGDIYMMRLNSPSDAIREYQNIIKKYPNHIQTAVAQMNIGDIMLRRGQYDVARTHFGYVINRFKNNPQLCGTAQFKIAFTYEKEGKWAKALNEYEWLWTKYPLTYEALLVPNHIAKYYMDHNMVSLARKAFVRAISEYQSFLDKYKKHKLAAFSQLQLAYSYKSIKKYKQAIRTAERIFADYPKNNIIPDAYLFIAGIYENELDNPQKAIKIYDNLLKKFPSNPNVAVLRKKIQILSKQINKRRQ